MFLPHSSCFFFPQKHFPFTVANHGRKEKSNQCCLLKQDYFLPFQRERKKNILIFQKPAELIQNKYFVGSCMWASAKSCWFEKHNNQEYFISVYVQELLPVPHSPATFSNVACLFSKILTSAWSQLKTMAVFSSCIHFGQQNDSELLAVRSKRSFTMLLSCFACNKLTATCEGQLLGLPYSSTSMEEKGLDHEIYFLNYFSLLISIITRSCLQS